ncbi:GTPase ObgE [Pseudoramibacter faecis]|uniref:GTPase ObgE n=1 Tax=Pseudoramibacter faecis TaxID=3108534 RepID=UPI002E75C2C6|nr:GTPase ObgE [Pseudoramibacter sp. HA2172]
MIDQVQIYVKAGRGGHGGMTFHRAKYIPKGGPDGGNGGKGGDVILQATRGLRTLAPFKYKKKYKAGNGDDGSANKSSGKMGENIIVHVPVGTIIKDRSTGRVLCDLNEDEQQCIVAKGGRGGLGNYNFTTSTRQSPRFAQGGSKGEEKTLILELKLLADVGLLGLPNVGKSTFLSIVTKANPKIGNYPFTTLEPNLGVVEWKNFDTFVVADIPGIIEGASEGAGIGLSFLRHVERTKMLIHFLDVSEDCFAADRDPLEDFNTINRELAAYSDQLKQKPQIVALTKCDVSDERKIQRVKEILESKGYEVYGISAVTRDGIDTLLSRTLQLLSEIPETEIFSEEISENNVTYTLPDRQRRAFDIIKEQRNGGEIVYYVEASFLDQLIHSVNFDDLTSVGYFQKRLKDAGIFRALEDAGIQEEDIVSIEGIEFEYFK